MEEQYLDNLTTITNSGVRKGDRTGVGTTSIHNLQLRADLQSEWPLLTTKKVSMINILTEWKWMMLGMTDVRWLQENNCTIWDEWATVSQCNKFNRVVGDMGPIYGHQWRNFGATKTARAYKQLYNGHWIKALSASPVDLNFDDISNPYDLRDSVVKAFLAKQWDIYNASPDNDLELKPFSNKYVYSYLKDGFDQVAWVLKELVTNPNSRRLIVSGWNPKEANEVALPPCHTLWQLHTQPAGEGTRILNLSLHARSTDYFLGLPYNIAFYAFMVEFFAAIASFTSGEVVVTSVDAHLYNNHEDAVETQLSRDPLPAPTFKFSDHYRKRLSSLGALINSNTDLDTLGSILNQVILEMDVRKDVVFEDYTPHPPIKADVAV